MLVLVPTSSTRTHPRFDHLIHLLQVPSADPQHVPHVHLGPLHLLHRSQRVDPPNPLCHPGHVLTPDQIHLVQHNPVRKRNLLHALVHTPVLPLIVQMKLHMLGIDQRHDPVQPHVLCNLRLKKERLRDRPRRRQPGRLYQNSVKLVPLRLDQRRQHVDQIRAHRAADAAVVEHHDLLLVGIQALLHAHQLAVDVNLTKLVLDHSDTLLMSSVRQDVVQQRRLARAQKPCEDGDGDAAVLLRPVQRRLVLLRVIDTSRWPSV